MRAEYWSIIDELEMLTKLIPQPDKILVTQSEWKQLGFRHKHNGVDIEVCSEE